MLPFHNVGLFSKPNRFGSARLGSACSVNEPLYQSVPYAGYNSLDCGRVMNNEFVTKREGSIVACCKVGCLESYLIFTLPESFYGPWYPYMPTGLTLKI
jgi:hypothetical protein